MGEQPGNSFGEYIYSLREARGWTFREAAGRIGIAHSRLTEIEAGIDGHTGKAFIPAYMIVVQMAKTYGVPTQELLRLAGHEPLAELEADEKRLMETYRALSPARRAQLSAAADALAAEGE